VNKKCKHALKSKKIIIILHVKSSVNTKIEVCYDVFLDCVMDVSKNFDLVFSDETLQYGLDKKKEIINRAKKEFPEFKKT